MEKFARNTGLKLFRTSVKENLNVSKVFHYLSERHIEAVSRWSDENGLEDAADGSGNFDSHIQIGGGGNHHNHHHQHNTHRVRFSSSTENIESSSGSSGSSNNSLSYFQANRLLPLGGGNRRRKNNNKKMQKHQHHQQQQLHHHHHQQQYFYAQQFGHSHPHHAAHYPQFGYPQQHLQQQQQPKSLNPFKRIGQSKKTSDPSMGAPFRLGAFPPPQSLGTPNNNPKPTCRVI